jgi:hypothetical protein
MGEIIMKKLLLICTIIALIASVGSLKAQNTVYFSFQPVDLGVGLRYDRQINDVGIYSSLTYGNYKFFGGHVDNHIKASFGGIRYFKEPCLSESEAFFTCGGTYHHYGEIYYSEGIPPRVFNALSFELGVGLQFCHCSVAFRMDVLKFDSSIDFGFRF